MSSSPDVNCDISMYKSLGVAEANAEIEKLLHRLARTFRLWRGLQSEYSEVWCLLLHWRQCQLAWETFSFVSTPVSTDMGLTCMNYLARGVQV